MADGISVQASDEVKGSQTTEKEFEKGRGIDIDYEFKRANDMAVKLDRWLERLKSETDDLEGKLDKKKHEVRSLEENLAILQSNADKNKKLIKVKNKTIAELKEEITQLEGKIILKDEEIAELKRTPVQPKNPPKSLKERELEKEIEGNRRKLEEAEEEGAKVNERLDKQKGKLGRMEAAERNRKHAQKYGK